MTDVFADLHVHTTRSDGTLSLEAVPAAARRAGVRVIGLTDHDRRQPFDGVALKRDGVTLLHGIELRVDAGEMRVDLLGYGLSPTAALDERLAAIQTNRRERARAIVERVEDRLGIDLDVSIQEGIGRPHIARAIEAHPGTDCDYKGAFDRLIGSDGPCYVPREIPTLERGLALLEGAAELVSLAHPLRYPDTDRALEVAAQVGAVEVPYPYGEAVDLGRVERSVERHGLLETGGSDAHDERVGRAGLSEGAYERLGLPTCCR